ncbi:hypothetical protein [Streptomyces goshikiensis]|uniref:hypothetical protein n=1 Tax=Streptomyces goshikiensis TaxID=1942 RepID=UPI003667ACD5
MSTETPTIPAETARHVIWTFGEQGGYRPGTFTMKLLELLAYADRDHTARLAIAYPVEAEAVRMAKYDSDGIDRLKRIAGAA